MESIQNKNILIDTNILVYCGDKGYGKDAQKLLRTLKDNKNNLATSEICCFELIKNAHNLTVRKYYLNLINYIHKIAVDTTALQNSALLYHQYHKEFNGNCKMGSVDIVIAGTVVYNKGTILLTANRKDFPMPFWKLVSQTYLMKKNGEGNEIVNIFALEFDYATVEGKEIK